MSDSLQQDTISFEEYLSGEPDVDIRSEYVGGQVYAIAGASEIHNSIAMSFASAIDNVLDESCRVWQSEWLPVVRIQAISMCAAHPVLIVEVLSNSTAIFIGGLEKRLVCED